MYNYWSEDLGGFKERVVPGAFSRTLVGGDVRALFNHNPNFLLGRTESPAYPRAFVRYLVNGGSMAAPDCG